MSKRTRPPPHFHKVAPMPDPEDSDAPEERLTGEIVQHSQADIAYPPPPITPELVPESAVDIAAKRLSRDSVTEASRYLSEDLAVRVAKIELFLGIKG